MTLPPPTHTKCIDRAKLIHIEIFIVETCLKIALDDLFHLFHIYIALVILVTIKPHIKFNY